MKKYLEFISENFKFNKEQKEKLKNGLMGVYLDSDRVSYEIDYLENILNEDVLKIYRVVFLPDKKFLNDINLGHHWSLDGNVSNYKENLKDSAIENFLMGYDGDEDFENEDFNEYLITGQIDKKHIDINNLISNFIEFPNEVEVYIPNTNNIKILSIKEI